MKRMLVLCIIVASLALLQSIAGAAGRPVKLGFGGGMSVPVSDAKDTFKSGFHGKAMVMWAPPVLPLGIRGSIGYERLDLKSPGLNGTSRILSGMGNLSFGFPVGPLKPYLIAGLGAFNVKPDTSGVSSPSKTRFGIDAGAGLEFKLGGIVGFVEGKFENIYTDKGFSSGVASAQAFKTQIIPVTFGIFF